MNPEDHQGPDFIGIGAARSGTTWIAANLSRSEKVWMPRRKELHYFSRDPKYPSPSFLNATGGLSRFTAGGMHGRRFRREFVKAVGRDVLKLSPGDLAWDLRYFLGSENADYYERLFAGHPGQLTGEITPAYALLDDHDVEAVCSRLPHTRFLYIVRNPIDRAWSTICYHESREKRGLTSAGSDKIREYLDQPGLMARSNYLEVIERWQRIAGPERLFLAFYDEITANPADLLSRMTDFLGLDDPDLVSGLSTKRVNASTGEAMPDDIRAHLTERYIDAIDQLADRVGGYAEQWRDRARGSQSSPGLTPG